VSRSLDRHSQSVIRPFSNSRGIARAYAAAHPPPLEHDDWFTPFAWSQTAELALYLDDAELGARIGQLMAPYAGQGVSAGSVLASGPFDLYLSMAARATSDVDLAGQHADRAVELCRAWQIPVVSDWLDRLRAEYVSERR
jgi:hypothetical protein